MNDTHPATAAVRVRAFLDAAERLRLAEDMPVDASTHQTVVSCAPTASGAVAPLYLDDLIALVDDGRGEQPQNVQLDPDAFTNPHGRFVVHNPPLTQQRRCVEDEFRAVHNYLVQAQSIPLTGPHESRGLFQFMPDTYTADTSPVGIPMIQTENEDKEPDA